MKHNFRSIDFVLFLGLTAFPGMAAANEACNDLQAIEHEVRHELVMLPLMSVFDNVQFQMEGTIVILLGQTHQPSLKNSAERAVARLGSVTGVENKIEVLPVSFHDNRIRRGVLRAVYGNSVLDRYALQAQPTIRIVVQGGNVTLEGVVASEMEKNVAFVRANSVSGVFLVMNNLKVEPTC